MPFRQDITASDQWFIGSPKNLVITCYESDGKTKLDLTGMSLTWMLKASLNDLDADAITEKTTSNGITLTSPTTGVCTVIVSGSDTVDLDPGTYYGELKQTNGDVLQYGDVALRRGVHRA